MDMNSRITVDFLKRARILFFVMMSLIVINTAYSLEFNFDKESLNFENVRRNGYSFQTLTITTDSPENIRIKYFIDGSMNKYIGIRDAKDFTFNKASPAKLLIEIKPDYTLGNGLYNGNILFTLEKASESMIDSKRNYVNIPYIIEITDREIKQAIVKNLEISDINIGSEINAYLKITNLGNVPVKPDLMLDFRNSKGIVIKIPVQTESIVLPGQDANILYRANSGNLEMGEYMLESFVILDHKYIAQQSQRFYVLPENEDTKKLFLDRIENDNEINVNSKIEINGYFENHGPDVLVKFVGIVLKDEKIYANIESNETIAKSGTKDKIGLDFIPLETGVYSIQGYIEYGARKTEMYESAFEAVPETQTLKEVPLSSNPVLAIVIMVIAIFTIVRINKIRNKTKKLKNKR